MALLGEGEGGIAWKGNGLQDTTVAFGERNPACPRLTWAGVWGAVLAQFLLPPYFFKLPGVARARLPCLSWGHGRGKALQVPSARCTLAYL